MRGLLLTIGAGLGTAAVACALIGGVRDRTGTFCTAAEHALCEDFDNPGAAFPWNGASGRGDPLVDAGPVPRGRSLPNAWHVGTPALGADASTAPPFQHSFERSPDGVRVSFSFFIDRLELPPATPRFDGGGPPASAVNLCAVQWNAGIVIIALGADDEISLLAAGRDPMGGNPIDPTFVPLNERDRNVRKKWISITFEIRLGGPNVSIIDGPDGVRTAPLPLAARNAVSVTDVVFGPIVVGPAAESVILFDDLQVDFR